MGWGGYFSKGHLRQQCWKKYFVVLIMSNLHVEKQQTTKLPQKQTKKTKKENDKWNKNFNIWQSVLFLICKDEPANWEMNSQDISKQPIKC